MKKLVFLLACFSVSASVVSLAQTTSLFPSPKAQFLDNLGLIVPGGKICTFQAGTTTPLASYADGSNSPATNSNPVVLDSAGRANVWLGPQKYKIVFYDGTGDSSCPNSGGQIWSVDNVSGTNLALQAAAAFAASAAPTCNAGQYYIWFDSSALRQKFCNNGMIDTVVGENTVDTFTNKTFSSGSFTGGTFTNPTINNPTFGTGGSTGALSAGSGILGVQNAFAKTQTITDITADTAYTAIGDSITNCYNVSTCFVNLIAAAKGWTLTAQGVNGDGIADESARAFADGIGSNSVTTFLCCVNDMRNNGSGSPGTLSTAQQTTWAATVLANLIQTSIPDAQKVWGDTNGATVSPVSYSGSWTSALQLGNHLYKTTGAGNTATIANLYGSTLYVLSAWQLGNTSTYKITVDGSDVSFTINGSSGTTLSTATGAWTSFNGRTFAPYAYRIAGLAKTNHTIVLTCLSADGSNPCYFLQASANSGATAQTGPFTYLGDTLRFSGSPGVGYAVNGGSDPAVSQHNARLKELQSELAMDGLHVSYVTIDANGGNGYFPSGLNTQADGVHPTNVGHAILANAFLAEMAGFATPKERAGAQALLNVPLCVYNGQLSNGGCVNGATAGDVSASESPTFGKLFLGTDGTRTVSRSGSTVGTNGPWDATSYTVAGVGRIYTVASDFTLAANTNLQTITGLTWTLPANTALTVPFSCHLLYSQATAAVADQFGIQSATISPTNIAARATAFTSSTASTTGTLATLASTTATAIVTFTPTATATVFAADISGLIENPSNVSSNAINIMAQQSNAADLVTVKRGSFCKIF